LDARTIKGLPSGKKGCVPSLLSIGSSSLVPFHLSRDGFCVIVATVVTTIVAEGRKRKSEILLYAINLSRKPENGHFFVTAIIIRKLPENTKRRLRIRAARNGHSMEQESRELLETGLARADSDPENLGEAIRRRFAPLGGIDLKIPPRRGNIREIQFK
jgi:plasmid stability protein